MAKHTPALKNLIIDLYTFTDEVDAQGQRVTRKTFKKDILKGYLALQKAISNQLINQVIDISNPQAPTEIVEVPLKDYVEDKNKRVISQKHTVEADLELIPDMIKALKYFWEDREEVPNTTEEAIATLEELIK